MYAEQEKSASCLHAVLTLKQRRCDGGMCHELLQQIRRQLWQDREHYRHDFINIHWGLLDHCDDPIAKKSYKVKLMHDKSDRYLTLRFSVNKAVRRLIRCATNINTPLCTPIARIRSHKAMT